MYSNTPTVHSRPQNACSVAQEVRGEGSAAAEIAVVSVERVLAAAGRLTAVATVAVSDAAFAGSETG